MASDDAAWERNIAHARRLAARLREQGAADVADDLCRIAARWEAGRAEAPACRSEVEIPIPRELWEDFGDDAPQAAERLGRWLTWLHEQAAERGEGGDHA